MNKLIMHLSNNSENYLNKSINNPNANISPRGICRENLRATLQEYWGEPVGFIGFEVEGLNEPGCQQMKEWFDKVMAEYNLEFAMEGIQTIEKKKASKTYDPSEVVTQNYFRYREEVCDDTTDVFIAPAVAISKNESEQFLIGLGTIACGVIVPDVIYYTKQTMHKALEFAKNYKETTKSFSRLKDEINKFPVGLCVVDRTGRLTQRMTYITIDKKITLNQFNKDLPNSEIENFITQPKNGAVILHGIPGCGKSSYIKYLIKNFSKEDEEDSTRFVLLSQNVLIGNIEQFKNMLLGERRNVIYIIEDCEELLKPRNSGNRNSTLLSDVLNFLDGIAAEACNAKFIFTFNTNLNEIDSAIMRKGRCRVRYEFKPLVGEYLKALCASQGYELTPDEERNGVVLTEIFNQEDRDNGNVKPERKKIGFA